MQSLHWETTSTQLKEIVQTISSNPAFTLFRLGGGTALSLQLGHRVSVDADFVTEATFDVDQLKHHLLEIYPHAENFRTGSHGLFCKIQDVKVDFLTWNLPFIRPAVIVDKATLLHLEEIAAMKLFAITLRGEKKDYIDIACLFRIFPLERLLNIYTERHPKEDKSVILKYLLSFSDIDKQPEPILLTNIDWDSAKKELADTVKDIL